MTSIPSGKVPDLLLVALRNVLREHSASVHQFGLRVLEDKVRPVQTGWAVPVASGVQTGSAYELARALERIQEDAEKQTSLSISLYLDPFAQSKN